MIRRFGLRDVGDALDRTEEPRTMASPRAPGPSAAHGVVETLARFVAAALTRAGDEAQVLDLLESLDPIRIDEVLPAARWLEQKGFALVLDAPRNGDWRLRLTDAGRQFAKSDRAQGGGG